MPSANEQGRCDRRLMLLSMALSRSNAPVVAGGTPRSLTQTSSMMFDLLLNFLQSPLYQNVDRSGVVEV